MGFNLPDLKKALKAAQDTGLTVTGYEIEQGRIRILTGSQAADEADMALAAWERKHGKTC